MRYELNELLTEEQVTELTAETFGGAGRKRHLWKRAAALVACMALVLGVFNFDAIAAQTEKIWRYIVGVGAVEAGSHILVQEEDLVWELEGRTYTLSGAYEKDGILSMHVLLRTEEEMSGDAWFDIVLLEDGEPCQTVWGYDAERSITPFQTAASWAEGAAFGGYLMPEAYAGTGAFAGTSPSFYTNGSGEYTVEIWRGMSTERGILRTGTPQTAQLTLQMPNAQSAVAHTAEQDGGTLTALVSEDGRRASFYLDGAGNGLSLRCPYDVWFVDEAGMRYRGAMPGGPANIPSQCVEVRLETTPEAPIVSIEVGALLLSKEDSEGKFLGYEERKSLKWTIPVA